MLDAIERKKNKKNEFDTEKDADNVYWWLDLYKSAHSKASIVHSVTR